MLHRAIAALRDRLSPYLALSKDRRETLALLVVAMVSCRTVNLSHLAAERPGDVQVESTYRRLQRFFQEATLDPDWAVPILAAMIGAERWTLALDRTNWKIGRAEVNYLVLAPRMRASPGASGYRCSGCRCPTAAIAPPGTGSR